MKKKFGKIYLFLILSVVLVALTIAFTSVALDYTDDEGIQWSYTVNNTDMTATITGVTLSSQTKEFAIPSHISDGTNTYTVTAIGSGAFSNSKCNNPKWVFGNLTIPDTVVSIGNEAFKNTYIFGKVVIPESVTSIGNNAFENCDGLTEVVLPSGLTTLNSGMFKDCFALNKVASEHIVEFKTQAFYNCRALYDITIGENARTIEENVFYDCDSLHGNIDISKITTISANAFNGCDNIESFTIPDVKHNMSAYSSCANVEAYYTTENNVDYLSIDGVLHSKDGTTVLVYPSMRKDPTFNLSETVTTIGKRAFNGTKYLEVVYINDKITSLEDEAFAGSSIKSIYIPDNITSLGFDTFKDCSQLEWVVFGKGVQLVGTGTFTGASKLDLIIAKNDLLTPFASNADFHYASEYHCINHIYGYMDKAPTCEESGYNVCIICDRYTYIKQTDHEGAILNEVKATCTTDGYRTVECFDCGETVDVVTTKSVGHISNGTISYVPSAYMRPEFTYSTCITCNKMYICEYNANFNTIGDVNCDGKINYTDLTVLEQYIQDNSSVTEISTENADINRDGSCTQEDVDYLKDFLTHRIDSLPTVSSVCFYHGRKTTYKVIEASCEGSGFTIRCCANCGLLTDEINTKKFEHTLTEKLYITSTCSMEGQRISDCSTCKKTIYETIKKTSHKQKWFTVDGQRGYEYSTCSVCGEIENRKVDYSAFDSLIQQIPKYYELFFQPESVNIVNIVKANFDKSLTQDEVDENVRILSNTLINPKYKVFETPVIFIDNLPTEKVYIPTSILVLGSDENGMPYVEAMDYNAQVEVRGKTSASHNKQPFNFKFSSKVDLFGMGAGKKYSLLSNYNDNTLLRNAIMFELSNQLGIDNSCKYQIVDVYIKGVYRGSYLLTTPVEVGENRVEIDEESDFLLEIEMKSNDDETDKECYNITSPIFNIYFKVNDPKIEDMNPDALSQLYTTVSNIDFAIMSGDWELIKQYVDVESVAKYYVLHELMKEIDIFWDSTRFYIKDGKIYGGPGWDFDLSMIYNGGGGQGESNAHSNSSGWVCEGGVPGDSTTGVWASIEWKYNNDKSSYRIWFCALYKHSPDFVKLVCETILEYNEKISVVYEDQVDENGKVVQENIIDSIINDPQNKVSITNNRNGYTYTKTGGNSGTVSRETYETNVNNLRDWLKRRNEWIQDYYAFKLEAYSTSP